MATICLMPAAVERFKQGLADGKIDPSKLSEMSSEERSKFFEDYVGKNSSKDVNALFESKLLLKNQQRGMITWAKTVAGLTKPARQDLISRISRMDRVLDPKDGDAFLKDLASKKLGIGVTKQEAKDIMDMSNRLTESKAAADATVKEHGYTKASEAARLKAGVDRVTLEKYIGNKKGEVTKKTFGQSVAPSNWMHGTSNLLGATKGLVASFTSHAPLKHGFPALFEDPKDWFKNYVTQFSDAAKEVKGSDVMSAIRAEGYSRENAHNGIYDKWIPGELSKINEEYHSDLPSKVYFLGRFYKGSKTMFDGFNLKMRMDLVDHYVNIVKKMGLDPQDPEVAKSWGKLAIDQTGGKSGNANDVANKFLFSERLLKAQTNNLTAHLFDKTSSTAVKVRSAKTLAKMITGVGALILTAHAINPKTSELNPTSANFGKIKIGDTRFDISGGYSSLITLAARLATRSEKSTSTNITTKIGTGFGQASYATLIGDFLQGRGSPTEQVISNLVNQQTATGAKPTVGNQLLSLVTPIPAQTYVQLKNDPNSAGTLLTMIAQQLGIMSNTYSAGGTPGQSSWLTSSSKELTQFKSTVGQQKFSTAANEYQVAVTNFKNKMLNNPKYNGLPSADKQKVITYGENAIKSAIFSKYNFTYKRQ